MRKQRDSNKTKKYMVYFMAFLMVGSLFGIVFLGFRSGGGGSGTVTYNDFQFINRGNYWSTNANGVETSFTFLPTELELILVDDAAINRLNNLVELDITSDFNDTFAEAIALAQFQMQSVLNNFNLYLVKGFTRTSSVNAPIITCNTATLHVPVIYFKQGNATKIYLQDNCIIAEAGSHTDILRLKDRIVYGMLGIIR